jgi:hypothetical protein
MAKTRCPECGRVVQVPDGQPASVRCPSCRARISLDSLEPGEAEPRQTKRQEQPRTRRRAYVHQDCGGTTVVSGDEFARVSNPFAYVSQTYCASCGSFAGLGRFSWDDTGENLAAFRRRMRQAAPASLKLWGWLLGPLLAATACGLVGYFCSAQLPLAGLLAGAVVGAAFFAAFLTPYMSQWFWGIDYRNKK